MKFTWIRKIVKDLACTVHFHRLVPSPDDSLFFFFRRPATRDPFSFSSRSARIPKCNRADSPISCSAGARAHLSCLRNSAQVHGVFHNTAPLKNYASTNKFTGKQKINPTRKVASNPNYFRPIPPTHAEGLKNFRINIF